MEAYIFVLCPPRSGSTILWNLVSTSSQVSALPREGQKLPEVRKILRNDPWNETMEVPWARIKDEWHKYWESEKPLMIEKSPPNLIRAGEIEKYFEPCYFLIMVRNPYAHFEGLMRKRKRSSDKVVEFIIKCLRCQMTNSQNLATSIRFKYEELVESPVQVCKKIESFIPRLGVLDYDKTFEVSAIDGKKDRKIVGDLNRKKIENLSPLQIARINRALRKNLDVMEYWGYELYEPSWLKQSLLFFKSRIMLFFSGRSAFWERLRRSRKLTLKFVLNLLQGK